MKKTSTDKHQQFENWTSLVTTVLMKKKFAMVKMRDFLNGKNGN